MPKVYNKNQLNVPPDAVYVGRPSKWGNQFIIGGDGTRKEVIEKHRSAVLKDDELVRQIKDELRGKDLVCHCVPKNCHAFTLMEIANSGSLDKFLC